MVSLAVRAALAKDATQNLPGTPTVSTLRKIAKSEKEKEQKALIQTFIKDDLFRVCERVRQWLLFIHDANPSKSGAKPSGLLPVHITSIAIDSREVYLLLLHFAKRMNGNKEPDGWNKTMQALATILHWFSVDKTKVVNRVYASCRDEQNMTTGNIRAAIMEAISKGELYPIHTPEAVKMFVQLPAADLKNWSWWLPILGDGKEDGIIKRRKEWEGFLNVFRSNRELLLYAQRDFLSWRFSDYDPARKDLWEAHNRPWDFDHILASYYFYNRKDGSDFRIVCGQWGNTIGNLRAWPFEDNRSDKDDTADAKIKGDKDHENSFLTPGEKDAFSGGDKTRGDEATARAFADNCRGRLLRIYREWYESVGIAELVPPCENN